MTAENRLDECMKKLGVPTDYQLAQRLGVRQARISAIRNGKEKPDLELCYKMADVLGISPAVIVAEVQVENAKNPDKALIFKHFLTAVGLWIILAVIPVNYGSISNNVQAAGNRANIEHKGSLCEAFFYFYNAILAIFGRYFTCNWTRKALRAS